MFFELLKRLLFEKFFKKFFAFIAAITIIPLAIYILELDKVPQWTQNKIYYVGTTLTVSVNGLLNEDEISSKKELKYLALELIKNEIYKKALKQIKISYEWETLDSQTKIKIDKFLKKEIYKTTLTNVQLQDTYKKDNKIYTLYSLKDEYILQILQDIYAKVNDII